MPNLKPKPYLPEKGHRFRAYQVDSHGERHYHSAGVMTSLGLSRDTNHYTSIDTRNFRLWATIWRFERADDAD